MLLGLLTRSQASLGHGSVVRELNISPPPQHTRFVSITHVFNSVLQNLERFLVIERYGRGLLHFVPNETVRYQFCICLCKRSSEVGTV